MRWIKCSDQMPLRPNEYLTAGPRRGQVHTTWYDPGNDQWYTDEYGDLVGTNYRPTHWMDMPEDPVEGAV